MISVLNLLDLVVRNRRDGTVPGIDNRKLLFSDSPDIPFNFVLSFSLISTRARFPVPSRVIFSRFTRLLPQVVLYLLLVTHGSAFTGKALTPHKENTHFGIAGMSNLASSIGTFCLTSVSFRVVP